MVLERIVAREDAGRVALAVHELSERDREVLRLVMHGAETEEVAERLALAPDAARKAVERAVRRLGKRL